MTRRMMVGDWRDFEETYQTVFGHSAPSPTEATVVVEKVDNTIIGFMTVRYIPVIELWVQEEHREGMNVIFKLAQKMREYVKAKEYLAFTKAPKLARLYHMLGMENRGTLYSMNGGSDVSSIRGTSQSDSAH